jgi:hypothetical protein
MKEVNRELINLALRLSFIKIFIQNLVKFLYSNQDPIRMDMVYTNQIDEVKMLIYCR